MSQALRESATSTTARPAGLTLVVSAIPAIGGAFTSAGPLFGGSFPIGSPSVVGYAVFGALQAALYAFITLTPLVLLVGVLSWLRMSRRAPAASDTPRA
jgi:hypothetical protein